MNEALIKNHNEIVGFDDIVIHAGDFTLKNKECAYSIIKRLNGKHEFIKGSHDYWLKYPYVNEIWERKIYGQYIVVCHYAMRIWPRSHYNSWQLYGHSHGKLEPVGKQWDIGVDNNNFRPISFEQLKEIMVKRPDNPNRVKK